MYIYLYPVFLFGNLRHMKPMHPRITESDTRRMRRKSSCSGASGSHSAAAVGSLADAERVNMKNVPIVSNCLKTFWCVVCHVC